LVESLETLESEDPWATC